MAAPLVPALLRSTIGRMRMQGIPRMLMQVSRFTLGTTPRLLPVAHGYQLHLDPTDGDQCMMYYGFYGSGILHCAREILRPGDTALDVGGQLGFFAAAFAQLVGPTGRVGTFEPDPRVWPRLTAGIEANVELNVIPRNAAVAASEGTMTLHVSPTAGWSTLIDCDYPEVESVDVQTVTLDGLRSREDLGWDRLRLIKIDVEGAEIEALRGMATVLDQHRPYLICEMNVDCLVDNGRAPDDLLQQIQGHGYQIQAIVEPRGVFRNGPPQRVPVRSAADLPWTVGDLLCSPEKTR